MDEMKRAMAAVAMLATGLLVVIVAGCSSGSGTASDGKPTLVTSTNVWAAVASAVAGQDATVTALYSDPSGDPHEFEPSAVDSAKVADADVVVMNGGHYDEYMEKASQQTSGTVINAFEVMGGAKDANEHVFYNLPVVGEVATKIADALADKDPSHAATYRANATAFNGKIDGLRTELATIKAAHDGTRVAQTEPLAAYLLTEAGLVDAAPAGFTASVEEGQSPSAADRAAMQDLLTERKVSALIYNTQAVDSVTEALLAVAKSANVPVVDFTETLPEGVTDYITWQQKQIAALSAALAK